MAAGLIERVRVASVTVGEKITEMAEKHPDIHMIVEDLMGMKGTRGSHKQKKHEHGKVHVEERHLRKAQK